MKIVFRTARLQRLFNDHAQLEARYGRDVAEKIATRMALLSVARHLGLLPARPPIRFRRRDDTSDVFTVDAGVRHRLQFVGVSGKARAGKPTAPAKIEEIEMIGVEDV
jgi:hypothetical protein